MITTCLIGDGATFPGGGRRFRVVDLLLVVALRGIALARDQRRGVPRVAAGELGRRIGQGLANADLLCGARARSVA
jgi:hypothetical protein